MTGRSIRLTGTAQWMFVDGRCLECAPACEIDTSRFGVNGMWGPAEIHYDAERVRTSSSGEQPFPWASKTVQPCLHRKPSTACDGLFNGLADVGHAGDPRLCECSTIRRVPDAPIH